MEAAEGEADKKGEAEEEEEEDEEDVEEEEAIGVETVFVLEEAKWWKPELVLRCPRFCVVVRRVTRVGRAV